MSLSTSAVKALCVLLDSSFVLDEERERERERVRGERMLGTGDVAPSSLASAEEGSGKLVSKAARDEQGGHQAWDGHKSVCLYTPPRALSLSLRWGPIHKENGWLEK